jgi:DNA-binding MarR family transcriptional regulator
MRLAEFYRQHPALYMEQEEMAEKLGVTREDLDKHLEAMETEKLVALYRKRSDITMAKATYAGLKKAKPQEYYLFFPDFVDKERETF